MVKCSKSTQCSHYPEACEECQLISDNIFPYQLFKLKPPNPYNSQVFHFTNGVQELTHQLIENHINQTGLIVLTPDELRAIANEIISELY